jgi:riboflavin synthase
MLSLKKSSLKKNFLERIDKKRKVLIKEVKTMFTGIIEGIGKIFRVEESKGSRRIWIESPFSLAQEKSGNSIAVDGCCLTITQKNKNRFAADVSPETLQRTTLGGLKKGMWVNLERPLRSQDRLGGHIVQGHVDGVARLRLKKQVKTKGEIFILFQFEYPKSLRKYLVEKGSIAIDGISLTLNQVTPKFLSVLIIPHTQNLTTLTHKNVGDRVNIEVDVLAKYLEKLIKR